MPFIVGGLLRIGKSGGTPPPSAPVLSSLSYLQGDPAGGGESIVLTGSGFTGATAVDFGFALASFVVLSDTVIVATLPPTGGGSGVVGVNVTGPGGTSGNIPFEYWTPENEPYVTLVYDRLWPPPYDNAAGIWIPRYTAFPGSQQETPGFALAPMPVDVDGSLVFPGTASTEAGLVSSFLANWNEFLGPVGPGTGNEQAGSIAAVFSSVNRDAFNSGAPFLNPTVVGATDAASGVIGMGFADDAGTPSVCAHTYPDSLGAYVPLAVQAEPGVKHAVVSRWGIGPGTFDISVDGATTVGPGYASTPIPSGVSATYTPTPIWQGMQYSASGPNHQTIRGSQDALVILNDKAPDAFLTKFHAWSAQRFGVGKALSGLPARGDCLAWFDTRSGLANAGGNVAAWVNQAVNSKSDPGRWLFQPDPTKRPLVISADPDFNGEKSVEFDGVDDSLESLLWDSSHGQVTVYVAMRAAGVQAGNYVFDAATLGTARLAYSYGTSGFYFAGGATVPYSQPADVTQIIAIVFDGAGSAMFVDDPTTPVASGDPGANAIDSLALGWSAWNLGYWWAGKIAAIGVFDGAHGTATRTAIMSELADRYIP